MNDILASQIIVLRTKIVHAFNQLVMRIHNPKTSSTFGFCHIGITLNIRNNDFDSMSTHFNFHFTAKTGKVEWEDEIVLNTQEEFDKYVEDGGFVKSSTNNHVNGDQTIYYRCKFMPKPQAKNCVRMKLFKFSGNMKFVVTRSVGEHDHSSVVYKYQRKIPELWEYIYNLKFEDGMKPQKIQQNLKRNRPDVRLNIRQIRHIIKSMEKIKMAPTFSFGELIE